MQVKNPFILACALVATMTLAACSGDSDDEYHEIALASPTGLAYADQTSDTLKIYSTGSWTVTTQDADWFTPTSFSREQSRPEWNTYPLTLQTNTTGKVKSALFIVKASGNKNKIYSSYFQVPWMNVANPNPVLRLADGTVSGFDSSKFSELKAYFTFAFTSAAAADTLRFTLYAPAATISTSDEWISLKQDGESVKTASVSREAGSTRTFISIPVSATANTVAEKRTGTITIATSTGIKQEVSITQEAAEKK